MKSILQIFRLKKEAILLDSRLYILKAMLAIGTGYLLGRTFTVTRLDMISVLLGVMYNLEPTNLTAFKSGVNQLLASVLGAVTTGILVALLGVHVFTVMLGMGLTMFIALKIDYRSIPPVAIFTSIYMTQYIQSDALGNPSILLTIRLRVLALGLGVIIALVYNYGFSFFYYRKIAVRRLEYAKGQCVIMLKQTAQYLTSPGDASQGEDLPFPLIFNDVDTVWSQLKAIRQESSLPFSTAQMNNLLVAESIVKSLKAIVHMAYDLCYTRKEALLPGDRDLMQLQLLIEQLERASFLRLSSFADSGMGQKEDEEEQAYESRRQSSISEMLREYGNIITNIKKFSA